MKSTRIRHSAAFKAKVALAAIREQETIPAFRPSATVRARFGPDALAPTDYLRRVDRL